MKKHQDIMREDGLYQSDDTGDCHLEAVCFVNITLAKKKISLSAKYPTEWILEEVFFHQFTKLGAIHIHTGSDFLQWDLNRGGK